MNLKYNYRERLLTNKTVGKQILLLVSVVVLLFSCAVPAQAFEQLPRSLAWELVSQSGVAQFTADGYPYSIVYAQPGETVSLWMIVKNRSRNPRGEVWYGAQSLLDEGPSYPNAHAIGVGTYDPIDNRPAFLDPSSFVINGNRFSYYNGEALNKGQTTVLGWSVKIADNVAEGDYNLVVSLVREFDEWGQRVTASGANHKYQGVLYRFRIGSAASYLKGWVEYPDPTAAFQEASPFRFLHPNTNDKIVGSNSGPPDILVTTNNGTLLADFRNRSGNNGSSAVDSMSLYQWALGTWSLNKQHASAQNPIGDLQTITINGATAYQFSFSRNAPVFFYDGPDSQAQGGSTIVPADKVIMLDNSPTSYLFSGRYMVFYPDTPDATQLVNSITW